MPSPCRCRTQCKRQGILVRTDGALEGARDSTGPATGQVPITAQAPTRIGRGRLIPISGGPTRSESPPFSWAAKLGSSGITKLGPIIHCLGRISIATSQWPSQDRRTRADSADAAQYSRLQKTLAWLCCLLPAGKRWPRFRAPHRYPESGPRSAPSSAHCSIHRASAAENSLNEILRKCCRPDTEATKRPR
jgi:hypothetical protein